MNYYSDKIIDINYCCDNQDIINDNGANICINCASIISYDIIGGWNNESWFYKKSVHSRKRWFYDKVIKYVKVKYVNTLVNDFIEVVNTMMNYNLLKGRNVSKYTYYIIRLASRRGIKVGNITDMKTPHIKKVFDDRLFGVIYPFLGWDINCQCSYYISWKNSHLNSSLTK